LSGSPSPRSGEAAKLERGLGGEVIGVKISIRSTTSEWLRADACEVSREECLD
jgi:hypothetical protein